MQPKKQLFLQKTGSFSASAGLVAVRRTAGEQKNGGLTGARTRDHRLKRAMLCRLSYQPTGFSDVLYKIPPPDRLFKQKTQLFVFFLRVHAGITEREPLFLRAHTRTAVYGCGVGRMNTEQAGPAPGHRRLRKLRTRPCVRQTSSAPIRTTPYLSVFVRRYCVGGSHTRAAGDDPNPGKKKRRPFTVSAQLSASLQ